MSWHLCVSHFSGIRLFVTPWIEARQAPLSVEFSRQEYWSGKPCPPSRGSSPPRHHTQVSCTAGRFFTIWATGDVWANIYSQLNDHHIPTYTNMNVEVLHPDGHHVWILLVTGTARGSKHPCPSKPHRFCFAGMLHHAPRSSPCLYPLRRDGPFPLTSAEFLLHQCSTCWEDGAWPNTSWNPGPPVWRLVTFGWLTIPHWACFLVGVMELLVLHSC